MGRVNNKTDVFRHIDMNPVHPCTCWLWTASTSDKGIPYFAVKGRKFVAYRLVYWLMHPEFDYFNKRYVIRHMCTDADGKHVDNPLCCNPAHLQAGTHDENMRDMMERGRKGLTREVLEEIVSVAQRAPDLTHSQIAKRVGDLHKINIARTTVTDILNGRRRKVLRDIIDARNKEIDDG